jgi:hypothetical protein
MNWPEGIFRTTVGQVLDLLPAVGLGLNLESDTDNVPHGDGQGLLCETLNDYTWGLQPDCQCHMPRAKLRGHGWRSVACLDRPCRSSAQDGFVAPRFLR